MLYYYRNQERRCLKMKKIKNKTWTEIIASERRDWNGVNPVTRVIPDKRRKPPKHKAKAVAYDAD